MKLKKLNIQSYRHLEGIDFDFTYPEGHAKAGQPLDKICIIGQSATGKTGVLEVLRDTMWMLSKTEIVNGTEIFSGYQLTFRGSLEFRQDNAEIILANEKIIKDGLLLQMGSRGGSIEYLIREGLRLLYFGADFISRQTIKMLTLNPIDILASEVNSATIADAKKVKQIIEKLFHLPNYFYEFTEVVDEKIWLELLTNVLNYRKRYTQMVAELMKKGAIGDLNKLNREYQLWAEENENPLIKFATFFNPILEKLNLEVDLINTEYTIPIKSKLNDEVIPISALSTGTKGLLISMFPLFELDTDDALILIDEPERSLFPDMQIELMQHYQRMAPKAQFVVATHSPFIAAAFEPAERFILYFDDKGKVAVRRGESPIGDDPNDMLRNDFNVDYYNEFGKKAYQDYLSLKSRIAQTNVKEEKEKLIVELAELGDKYNF